MKQLHALALALASLVSGCAFNAANHDGTPDDTVSPVVLDASEVAATRPCGRALSDGERLAFLSSVPRYSAVWATGADGAIWHADRAAGVTHRLLGGVDTVIPFGGASVAVLDGGRVILTSFATSSVYEVFGDTARVIAGSGAAGHVDGSVSDAAFDMPYSPYDLPGGGIGIHDVGNIAVRRIGSGRVTTERCTAKE